MAMQLGGGDSGEDELVSTINTTPLVDVMLVLLIIFLITIPVVTHTVPVTLPHEHNQPLQTKPQNINVSVNRNGDIFWNQTIVPDRTTLTDDFKKIAVMDPQPAVQIRGDSTAQYKSVGEILFICQQVGITKVNFIIDPTKPGS
jgi:biopolymer transport protein ExbD